MNNFGSWPENPLDHDLRSYLKNKKIEEGGDGDRFLEMYLWIAQHEREEFRTTLDIVIEARRRFSSEKEETPEEVMPHQLALAS